MQYLVTQNYTQGLMSFTPLQGHTLGDSLIPLIPERCQTLMRTRVARAPTCWARHKCCLCMVGGRAGERLARRRGLGCGRERGKAPSLSVNIPSAFRSPNCRRVSSFPWRGEAGMWAWEDFLRHSRAGIGPDRVSEPSHNQKHCFI